MSVSVALAAASASFSIAWYATSANVYVESIIIGADPERELLIGLTEEGEFKPALASEELERIGRFTPVSTCFASRWRGKVDKPAFFDLSHPWLEPFEPYAYPGDQWGYFSQAVYLKADDDVIAGIDFEALRVIPDQAKNWAYAQELARIDERKASDPAYVATFRDHYHTAEEHLDRLNAAVNCARVSLLVDDQYFIVDPNKDDAVVYGGALDNNNDGYYDAYTLNGESYETFYGELKEGYTRQDLVYLPSSEQDSASPEEFTAFDARHKKGVHALDLEASKDIIAVEPSLGKAELNAFLPMPSLNFNLDAYTPKRVVVSFFLEGWDLDSVNGAMGASFDLDLSFKIIRER